MQFPDEATFYDNRNANTINARNPRLLAPYGPCGRQPMSCDSINYRNFRRIDRNYIFEAQKNKCKKRESHRLYPCKSVTDENGKYVRCKTDHDRVEAESNIPESERGRPIPGRVYRRRDKDDKGKGKEEGTSKDNKGKGKEEGRQSNTNTNMKTIMEDIRREQRESNIRMSEASVALNAKNRKITEQELKLSARIREQELKTQEFDRVSKLNAEAKFEVEQELEKLKFEHNTSKLELFSIKKEYEETARRIKDETEASKLEKETLINEKKQIKEEYKREKQQILEQSLIDIKAVKEEQKLLQEKMKKQSEEYITEVQRLNEDIQRQSSKNNNANSVINKKIKKLQANTIILKEQEASFETYKQNINTQAEMRINQMEQNAYVAIENKKLEANELIALKEKEIFDNEVEKRRLSAESKIEKINMNTAINERNEKIKQQFIIERNKLNESLSAITEENKRINAEKKELEKDIIRLSASASAISRKGKEKVGQPERELKQGNKRIFSFGKDDNEILETKKWSSMNMNVNPTTINTKNMKNIFPSSSKSKKNSVKRLQKNNPYKKLFSIEEEEANSKMNFNEKRKTMNSVFDYRQIEKVPKLNTKEDVSNMNTNTPPKNTTPMNTNASKPSTSTKSASKKNSSKPSALKKSALKPSTSKKTVQIK